MNNDLISRSVLKEEVKKLNEMLPNLTDEKDKQSVRFAINILQDLIDNAPTVETYTKEEVQEIREEVAKEFKDIIDNATTVDYKDLYIQLGYEQGYERAKKENNNE